MPRLFTVGSIVSHAIVVGSVLAAQALDRGPLPSPRTPLTFEGSIPVRIADISLPPPRQGAAPPPTIATTAAIAIDGPPTVVPDGIHPERESASLGGDPRGGGLSGVGFGIDGAALGDPVYVPPPPPPPAPQKPVPIGGDIAPPRQISRVAPNYPALARASRVSGVVILEATIDTRGRVVDVRVLRSIPLLDQAAVDAVRQWTYTPTLLNGQPVPIVMTVTVVFTLAQP